MLDNSIDLFDTTDFRNKSVLNSMKRISRNLAIDYNKKNIPFILKIVDELIYEQKKQIFTSINNLIKLHKLSKNLPIITCGIGKDIIKKFALSEGYNTSDFSSYIFGSKKNIDYASMHAPALSCAFLVSSFK